MGSFSSFLLWASSSARSMPGLVAAFSDSEASLESPKPPTLPRALRGKAGPDEALAPGETFQREQSLPVDSFAGARLMSA